MELSNNFDFKILNDEASLEDLFEYKTHQRSAEVLYEVILASEGGITIGLEGTWGAGKSTVINMFHQNLINKNESTLFFLFDAWSHEDEPLRRIFLESLICTIDSQSIDEELQNLYKELTGRKKRVEIKSKKSASRLGKLLSLCAFLIPIGVAFFNKLSFDKLTFDTAYGPYWTFIILFPLSIITLFSPVWVFLYWLVKGDIDHQTQKKNWDFFKTESTEDFTQDIAEHGERTSIEFQTYFDQILNLAFSKFNYNKVIIVIDNLDRIDSDQAKSIWSTLQTFFQNRSLSQNQNKKNIWFIVPYDREGFSAIWDKNNSSTTALSFLDKCFQVRVEVPQPITSSWIKYCQTIIDHSLVGWNRESKEELLSEYSRIVTFKDYLPTPRRIRAWVNQVGMNGYRWQGKFSSKAIALYSFLKMEYSENDLKIALSESDFKKLSFNNDQNLMYELAGLLFGVEKEKGAELLLKDIIQMTIDNKNKDDLRNVANNHKEVFWLTLHTYWNVFFEKNMMFLDGKINHFTKYILAELNIFNDKFKPYTQLILSQWKEIQPKDWELDEVWGYSSTLRDLINFINNEEDKKWLNLSVKKLIQYQIVNIENIKNSDPLIELKGLIDLLSEFKVGLVNFSVSSLNKDNWTKWLKMMERENVFLKEIIPNQSDFSKWSVNIFSNPQNISKDDLDLLVKTTGYIQEEEKWKPIVNKLIEFLSLNVNSRIRDLDGIYELAFVLLSKFSFNFFKDFFKINQEFKQTLMFESQINTPSLNYLAILIFEETIQKQTQFERNDIKEFWKSKTPENINNTIDYLSRYNQLGLISKVARDSQNLLALEIIKKSDDVQLFGVNSETARFIDEYDLFFNDVSITKNLVNKICLHGGISKSVEREFDEDPIEYSQCMKLIFEYGDEVNINKMLALVRNISRERWEDDFVGDKKLLNLFEYNLDLDYKFSEAFFSWVLFCIKSDDSSQEKVWSLFYKIQNFLLDKEQNFNESFDQFLLNETDNITDSGFNILHQNWINCSILSCSQVAQKIKIWIDDEKWDRISWILDKELPTIDQKYESLISRVIAKLEEYKDKDEFREEVRLLHHIYDVFK